MTLQTVPETRIVGMLDGNLIKKYEGVSGVHIYDENDTFIAWFAEGQSLAEEVPACYVVLPTHGVKRFDSEKAALDHAVRTARDDFSGSLVLKLVKVVRPMNPPVHIIEVGDGQAE